MKTERIPRIFQTFFTHGLFLVSIIGLFLISRLDFVIFHLIVELYTILISACMFIILWNNQRYSTNNYFIIISIGFLFSSLIDFLHALSYKGMPFISGYTTDLPTQLWIAARYLQSLTFILAPIFTNRKIKIELTLSIYSMVTLLLVLLIFRGYFPVCFIDGVGLTPFKIISEYIISLLFLVGGLELFFKRSMVEKPILFLVMGSIFFTIFAELVFTLYINVFGNYSLIGHLLRTAAYYLISLALIKATLENPYSVIFRELKQKESELEDARTHYQTLFMEAPIRIWEEDFSLVKQEIDKLRAEGIQDFQAYFDSNRDDLSRCIDLVKIISWNKESERHFPELRIKNINPLDKTIFGNIEGERSKEFIAISRDEHNIIFEAASSLTDGKINFKLVSWAVVTGHEQDYSKVIVLVQDISEMKQMEEKLRESEERFRLLFDNAGIVIGCYDLNGNILAFNDKALEVMGGKLEDFIGKNTKEIVGPEMGQRIIDRIHRTSQSEITEQFEDFISLPTGDKWFISSYSRIMNNQSNCVGIQIISQDITDRKHMEEELHRYSAGLENLVKERTSALEAAQAQLISHEKLAIMGQMASGVGHELRNPLAVINNALYILKKTLKDPDEQTKTYLRIIGQEVGTSDKIISDLLTFARIRAVDKQSTSLPKLVDKVLQRYFPPENVTVENKLAQDLLPIMVDAGQIEQVLINLFTNAYQAMPEGGKLIISGLKKNDRVSLKVKDTGIGIANENLEKIFEPLFTTKAKGIGLGLTVTKLLTEANEGRISVKSKIGIGTEFTISLPTK
jgi:PAS domain S-box-containing protein